MASRSQSSSTSTVLLVLILIITFPLWIALLGGLIGIAGGLLGAVIGVVGALFGVLIAIIFLPFKILFGWGDWHGHWDFPSVDLNGYVVLAIVILVYLFYRKRG